MLCFHSTSVSIGRLQRHIAGQNEGVDCLLGCLEAWEMSKDGKVSSEPLVMAITGPTGVGKSETGFRMADALLATPSYTNVLQRVASGFTAFMSGTSPMDATGLLVIQGGDYSVGTLSLYGADVAIMRNALRKKLYVFLRGCQASSGVSGRGGTVYSTAGVVIIDEVEKMAPGSLDVSDTGC